MAKHTPTVDAPTPQTLPASTTVSTARFALPAEGFALTDVFEAVPDVRLELDPTIANPDDHALLVVRTSECEHTVDAALRSAPNIAAVEQLGKRADGWTYRVTWKDQSRRLIQRFITADITLLSAEGRGGEWELRLLTPSREGIARASDIMNDLDCVAKCRSISNFDGEGTNSPGLTDEQRETLIGASEAGYYNFPREVTMKELADDLGVTHQALSERFRRAYQQLVETELIVNHTANE